MKISHKPVVSRESVKIGHFREKRQKRHFRQNRVGLSRDFLTKSAVLTGPFLDRKVVVFRQSGILARPLYSNEAW